MRQIYFYSVLWSLWIVTVGGAAEPNKDHQPNQVQNRPIEEPRTQLCWHRDLARLHDNLIKPGGENDIKNDTLKHEKKEYAFKESYQPANSPSRLVVYKSKDCDLVFAFKGTDISKVEDIIHDVNFLPKKGGVYHDGFKQAAEIYAEYVLNEIKKLPIECVAPKITFTGHSLGGAIAYLMANANLNQELRKKLESFRPRPELVLFGTPRVAIQNSGKTGLINNIINPNGIQTPPIDNSKAIHYYIENDPVPVMALNPPFQDLTDINFGLETIPVDEKVFQAGTQVAQNHLPFNYLKRMEEACNKNIGLSKTTEFNYSPLKAANDTLSRYSRAGLDKVIENVQAAADKIKEGAEIAQEAAKGAAKVVVAKAKEGAETTQQGIKGVLVGTDHAGNPNAWGLKDGESFAVIEACNVSSFFYSKTRNGRDRYCDGTQGYNQKAIDYCENKCGTEQKNCSLGCRHHFSMFCIGNRACPGDKLSGE